MKAGMFDKSDEVIEGLTNRPTKAKLAADTASPVYEFVKPLEEKGITNV